MKLEAITNAELSVSDGKFVRDIIRAANRVNDGTKRKEFSKDLASLLEHEVDIDNIEGDSIEGAIEFWRLLLSNNMDRIITTVILHNLLVESQLEVSSSIDVLFKVKEQLKLVWANSVVVGD